MEVRDFIDEEVTVFKENGLTPAAETLVHEEFLLEDEAILEAYHNACDELAEEIEILFDRSSAYSLVDPDDDTFEELCGMLDEIPTKSGELTTCLGGSTSTTTARWSTTCAPKHRGTQEDVPPANQFYTPHWVVRMLTDNSLGKLYPRTHRRVAGRRPRHSRTSLPMSERTDRFHPTNRRDIADFCTYLVPSDEKTNRVPEFDHPSGTTRHRPSLWEWTLPLYAFDVLERIWWAETDLDRSEIPRKILEHNLYGVDIDMRSCQLAAFNLYLKARNPRRG